MEKLTKLILAAVIGVVLPSPFAAAQETGGDDSPITDEAMASELEWFADFDVAQRKAKAEGKDMLVDFTGSDWCVWCHRLDGEVFSKASFQEYAAENFVVVALYFPNDEAIKAKVPNPERNEELMKKFGVSGFPTVLLLTPEGEVYGKTGYRPDGPEGYIENLTKLRTEGKAELAKAKALQMEWSKATDANRMAIYDRVLMAFDGFSSDYMGRDILADTVKAAFEFDADNAKGYKLKATKTLLNADLGDEQVFGACRELDPENKAGLLELAIMGEMGNVRSADDLPAMVDAVVALDEMGIKDEKVAAEMYFNAAYWCWQYTEQPELARKFAIKLEALKGDDERTKGFLKDLFEDIGREEAKM